MLNHQNRSTICQQIEQLEVRDTPAGLFAVAADTPGGPRVTVYDTSGAVRFDFLAYASNVFTGVRVATGDVTGDGVEDIVTAPGPNGGPDIRVYDGATAGTTPALVGNFLAFGAGDTRGNYVAVGDVNGDGRGDVIVSGVYGVFQPPGGGPYNGQPMVIARSGSNLNGANIYAYNLPSTFQSSTVRARSVEAYTVAAADVNSDGLADVIVGSPDMQFTTSDVAVINSALPTQALYLYNDPNVNAPSNPSQNYTSAIAFVAGGDLTGDGRAEVVFSRQDPNTAGTALVRVYDPATTALVTQTNPFAPFIGQVRMGVQDANGDGRGDLIFGAGPGGGPRFTIRDYLSPSTVYLDQLAPWGSFTGGVYVG